MAACVAREGRIPSAAYGYEFLGWRSVSMMLAMARPSSSLHAFPLDRRMWQRQADDLKHALRVITVDFRSSWRAVVCFVSTAGEG
jgi:hypothetical protein